MVMVASFVVYIDESGDEGFLFERGSSEWFILSAAITRKENDLETVKLVDTVRAILGRSDQDPLHFRKLKHEHRIPYLHKIAEADLKAICVFVHKKSIDNTEEFQKKNRLYFYAARFLLERVSWYCDEHQNLAEGDGSAEIIFSNRGGMEYEAFREYLDRLKAQPFDIQINWDIIKRDKITAFSAKRMGLQIADAIASGFFFATNLNQFGFAENRYAQMLKPTMFSRRGQYKGYGLKFWPRETDTLIKKANHLNWLQTIYQFE